VPLVLAKRFLRTVWGKQYGEGHPILAAKDWSSGSWQDIPASDPLSLPTLDDLYFAPTLFSEPRRQKQFALPGKWLYADLDEVVPDSIAGHLRPTIAWETSEGRFQCMWLLERPLRPEQLEVVNQKLTYFVGADKGGWSCTKVLRVPGSFNNKRGDHREVKLLWATSKTYQAAAIYDAVKSTPVGIQTAGELADFKVSKSTPQRLRKRWGPKLTIEAKRLLKEEVPVGSRSEALYKLEMLLAEVGVPPAQSFVMVKAAPCNKYRGQQREDQQLWSEVNKAADTASTNSSKNSRKEAPRKNGKNTGKRNGATASSKKRDAKTGLHFVKASDFRKKRLTRTSWAIEGIWSDAAHGVVAGPPKSFKSLVALDMGISVASGTHFLNQFKIGRQGPVMMIQKENNEGDIQDLQSRIETSRGLGQTVGTNGSRSLTVSGGADYPFYLANNPDFDLTDSGDLSSLRKQIRRLNPVLLILDPLYLMTPGVDENSAHEMTPVLEWLLRVKQNYNCGTLLIHHFKKANAENPVRTMVERISGTGVFGRWYESAVLLERPDESEAFVHMTSLHRGHAPRGRLDVQFDLGSEDDLTYAVQVDSPRAKAKDEFDAIREAVEASGRVTLSQVMKETGSTNRDATKRRVRKAGLQLVMGTTEGRAGKTLYVQPKQD
jgi:hypothetical protein